MSKNLLLPNFFILGSAKCGTTALYEVLRHHPDIYFPLVKEPQFFCNDDLYAKGLEYYSKTYFSKSINYKAIGEATPHYMYYEKVAKRISENIPANNQRFILILRNPVKRAYSLYWNMVREGLEGLGFSDAINAEDGRAMDSIINKTGALQYLYLDSGLYAKQIDMLLKYFHRENILILFHDDLITKPEKVYEDIFIFLGVSKVNILSRLKDKHNQAAMPKYRGLHKFLRGSSRIKKLVGMFFPYKLKYLIITKLINLNMKVDKYPEISPDMERKLKKCFLNDINRLEVITGRNLANWK